MKIEMKLIAHRPDFPVIEQIHTFLRKITHPTPLMGSAKRGDRGLFRVRNGEIMIS